MTDSAWLDVDDVQRLDNVLRDTPVPEVTRRSLISRAATGAVVVGGVGALGPVSSALAAATGPAWGGSASQIKTTLDTGVTAEALAVTFLTSLVLNARAERLPGFTVPILKAANAAEQDHYLALRKLGAKPLTLRFWIPDYFFNRKHTFAVLEEAETLFVNHYLIAVTLLGRAGNGTLARYATEIAGVESEHRALVRFAQGLLPNNKGFETYLFSNPLQTVAELEAVGVGFGKRGSKPGRFYSYRTPPARAVVPITSPTPT